MFAVSGASPHEAIVYASRMIRLEDVDTAYRLRPESRLATAVSGRQHSGDLLAAILPPTDLETRSDSHRRKAQQRAHKSHLEAAAKNGARSLQHQQFLASSKERLERRARLSIKKVETAVAFAQGHGATTPPPTPPDPALPDSPDRPKFGGGPKKRPPRVVVPDERPAIWEESFVAGVKLFTDRRTRLSTATDPPPRLASTVYNSDKIDLWGLKDQRAAESPARASIGTGKLLFTPGHRQDYQDLEKLLGKPRERVVPVSPLVVSRQKR